MIEIDDILQIVSHMIEKMIIAILMKVMNEIVNSHVRVILTGMNMNDWIILIVGGGQLGQ